MLPLEEFESVLKEVVQAKRLSASKMGKLTEIALNTMENDTQLVSILYRTHKSLRSAAKVHSLYVFDALSRAARHQVNKQGLSGDINSRTGNCATFLLKVEGVVEGVFQDMVSSPIPESKEKTKKILDIWMKGNTFPTGILSRLTDVVNEVEKVSVPEVKPMLNADKQTVTLSTSVSPILAEIPETTTPDPQATLLALLTQAANTAVVSTSAQTASNAGAAVPSLDATQLALLRQLAQTATAAPSLSSSVPLPAAVLEPAIVPQAIAASAVGSSSQSPPSVPEGRYLTSVPRDPRSDRFRSPEHGSSFEAPLDGHVYPRGSSKGGYKNRGRGDRRRWEDRDRGDRYRDRERDWSPPRRGGRSRSRSPPSRYGGRRDLKALSPSRRSAGMSPSWHKSKESRPALEPGKDEFGRDIRPQSPDDTPPSAFNDASRTTPPLAIDKPTLEPSSAFTSNHDPVPMSPLVAANTSSNQPSASFVSSTVSPQPGMEQFDLATFNFTSPASWEALGKMWQVTNGYMPTTEQLMQFVVSLQAGQSATQEEWSGWPAASSSGQTWGNGRGRGGPTTVRGRGGFIRGKGRNGPVAEGWNHDDNNYATDAVVLGGSDMETSKGSGVDRNQQLTAGESGKGASGGRMQRIGDKWVFIRDPMSSVS